MFSQQVIATYGFEPRPVVEDNSRSLDLSIIKQYAGSDHGIENFKRKGQSSTKEATFSHFTVDIQITRNIFQRHSLTSHKRTVANSLETLARVGGALVRSA